LEIDCPVTDEVLKSIFTNLSELRDFRLQQCRSITDAAFTPLSGVEFKKHESTTTLYRTLEHPGNFDQLRMLDLTNASYITDEAIRLIIHASPKIRNLVLNKCKEISDQGVSHICQLGRHLHYLHLGHCENLTDRSITQLTRTCTRLRYLDLAQCSLLTNTAVQALATLPRLKRIGLVKCLNITDEAIDALTKQPRMAASLERVHLSYCIKLSEQSIRRLLNFCPRLNHLSLTHVPAFLRPDFQRFRRIPPKNFTPQQQNVFCVFSGKGVKDLKVYLNEIMTTDFLPQSNSTLNDDPATTAPLFPHTPRDAGLNPALLELNPQARFQHVQFLYQQHQQRQQQRDQQHEQQEREEQGDRTHNTQDDTRTPAAPIPPIALGPDGAPADGVNDLFFVDDERLME
jgi:F-box and leucine-rich repeat protein GRR1